MNTLVRKNIITRDRRIPSSQQQPPPPPPPPPLYRYIRTKFVCVCSRPWPKAPDVSPPPLSLSRGIMWYVAIAGTGNGDATARWLLLLVKSGTTRLSAETSLASFDHDAIARKSVASCGRKSVVGPSSSSSYDRPRVKRVWFSFFLFSFFFSFRRFSN